jgi:hypothetical protein
MLIENGWRRNPLAANIRKLEDPFFRAHRNLHAGCDELSRGRSQSTLARSRAEDQRNESGLMFERLRCGKGGLNLHARRIDSFLGSELYFSLPQKTQP